MDKQTPAPQGGRGRGKPQTRTNSKRVQQDMIETDRLLALSLQHEFGAPSTERGGQRRGGSNRGDHLLNFQSNNENTTRSRVNPRRPNNKPRRFTKDDFVLSSCRFQVTPNACDYRMALTMPDQMVEWDHIDQVFIHTSEEARCPICLDYPIAGHVTRCGHLFCLPCIVHHISNHDSRVIVRCPVCPSGVDDISHLRPALPLLAIPPVVGSEAVFSLVKRQRYSCVPVLAEHSLPALAFPPLPSKSAPFQHITMSTKGTCEWYVSGMDQLYHALEQLYEEQYDSSSVAYIIQSCQLLHRRYSMWRALRNMPPPPSPPPLPEQPTPKAAKSAENARNAAFPPLRPQQQQSPQLQPQQQKSPQQQPQPQKSPQQQPQQQKQQKSPLQQSPHQSPQRDPIEQTNKNVNKKNKQRKNKPSQDFPPLGPSHPPAQPQTAQTATISTTTSTAKTTPFVDTETDPGWTIGENAQTPSPSFANPPHPDELNVDQSQQPQTHSQPQQPPPPQQQSQQPEQPHQPEQQLVLEQGGDPEGGEVFFYYQSSDGQRIFLDAFTQWCLKQDFPNPSTQPQTLQAKVVNVINTTMTQNVRQRNKALSHLPLNCSIAFCELDLSNTLSPETYEKLAGDIKARDAERKRKKQQEDKAHKKQEANWMHESFGAWAWGGDSFPLPEAPPSLVDMPPLSSPHTTTPASTASPLQSTSGGVDAPTNVNIGNAWGQQSSSRAISFSDVCKSAGEGFVQSGLSSRPPAHLRQKKNKKGHVVLFSNDGYRGGP